MPGEPKDLSVAPTDKSDAAAAKERSIERNARLLANLLASAPRSPFDISLGAITQFAGEQAIGRRFQVPVREPDIDRQSGH